LPSGLRLTNPKSMKIESLINFFKHIAQREASHGITNAFRFKNVLTSRKKGVFRPARYREDGEESDGGHDPVPIRRKRRKNEGQVNLGNTILNPQAEHIDRSSRDSTPAEDTDRHSLREGTAEVTNSRSASLMPISHTSASPTNVALPTPSYTPDPPPRRSRKSIGTPAHSPSETGPRRSQRTTAQNIGRILKNKKRVG